VDKTSTKSPEEERLWPLSDSGRPARFYRQLVMTTLTVVLVAALVFLLDRFAAVLQQLLTAGFLAYIILPVQRWLVRYHVPGPLAFLVIVAAILCLGGVLALAIQASFADLSAKLPAYQKSFAQLVEDLARDVPGLEEYVIQPLLKRDASPADRGVQTLRSALSTLVGFVGNAFVVLIYLVFLLAEQAGVRGRIAQAFGPERAPYVLGIVAQINESIAQYISVKTLMSVLGGVLTTAILYGFGVDYAVLWGVLAFLLNYIPYLGSLVATVLPVLLALVQFQSLGYALVLLVALGVMQNGIAYGIEPFLASSRLNLSPLVIILALAFWGALWGLIGVILAVPLTVTIKIVLENIPATRYLAILMSHAASGEGIGAR
jgi:predicted PurR-regulated permease PerM